MRKNYLFVDGSNLNASQYELFGPDKYLEFPNFIKNLEKKLKLTFDRIYFYTSFSPKPNYPTKKQKEYLKNEALFYKSVKKTTNVIFFTGYRSKTSGKEKEVDVKLAVDIVHYAHLNKYSKLYLCSGDADFMHALHIANELHKNIAILALENRIPVRFSYYYQTFVIRFDSSHERLKILPRQKISTIEILKNRVIQKI